MYSTTCEVGDGAAAAMKHIAEAMQHRSDCHVMVHAVQHQLAGKHHYPSSSSVTCHTADTAYMAVLCTRCAQICMIVRGTTRCKCTEQLSSMTLTQHLCAC
jgi:hypothetical protein